MPAGGVRWQSSAGFVFPDDVGALADGRDFDAVGDDLDDAVVMAGAQFVGDLVVQGDGVGVVQRDVGEVAAVMNSANTPGLPRRSPRPRAMGRRCCPRGQHDVARARPALTGPGGR